MHLQIYVFTGKAAYLNHAKMLPMYWSQIANIQDL